MFGRRFCCHRRAVTEKSDHASGAAGSASFVGQMSAKFENEAAGGGQDAGPTPSVDDGNDEGPSLEDWTLFKKAATEKYMADDFQGAIELYGRTIKALEASVGSEPTEAADRKALAILYTNRSMAALQIIRRTQAGKKCGPQMPLPADLRRLAMRANVDASNALDLDEDNPKAWLRKGQALLWMSALPQRAKESMQALERARDNPRLPASMKPEVAQWHGWAKRAFNEQTPMHESCPQM